jgi:hypothetical protein
MIGSPRSKTDICIIRTHEYEGCSCPLENVPDKCERNSKRDLYNYPFRGTTWEDKIKNLAIVVV